LDHAPPPITSTTTRSKSTGDIHSTTSSSHASFSRQTQQQPQQAQPQQQYHPRKTQLPESPSLEPYVGKLERFELFSTNQCYYLIGCDKLNTTYRILKMDRTLIEGPPDDLIMPSMIVPTPRHHTNNNNNNISAQPPSSSDNTTDQQHQQQQALEATHNSKPTLRPLSEFLTEDPHIYSQEEIADLLDTIHEGNRFLRADQSSHQQRSTTASPDGNTTNNNNAAGTGGLKPIVRAYGIVGFVRFLDCYYLTLITRRAKVGNIGGNGIFTIKVKSNQKQTKQGNLHFSFCGCSPRFNVLINRTRKHFLSSQPHARKC
jgi:hypothetical protein